MKILQINTVYKNGGSTGRIAYDLRNIILASGNEAYVAYGYEFIPLSEEDYEGGLYEGADLTVYITIKTRKQGLFTEIMPWGLSK